MKITLFTFITVLVITGFFADIAHSDTLDEVESILGKETQKQRKKKANEPGFIPDMIEQKDLNRPRFPTFEKSNTFFWFPNSFSFRPLSDKSLETEGFPTAGDYAKDTAPEREFNLLKFWGLTNVYPLKNPWTWGLRFSPALNYFSWKIPGDIKFLHISYNAKVLLKLWEGWGMTFASVGYGPMYVSGRYVGTSETSNWIRASKVQFGWMRFMFKRFFVQLKHTTHNFDEPIFEGNTFRLRNVSATGIYLGWFFGKFPK